MKAIRATTGATSHFDDGWNLFIGQDEIHFIRRCGNIESAELFESGDEDTYPLHEICQ